jgi:hypothetical protein
MAEQVESPPLPNLVTGRVLGLDALRFWLAFVVFMGHGAWASYLDLGDFKFGSLIKGFLANAACGPAAVTVFFVVSGFCIHFPYRSGTKQLPDLGSFLVRRWVRTLVPLGIAYLVAFGLTARWDALTMVVWSLVCEEIYYLLYPSLLSGSRKIGWPKLLAGSMVAALAVILTKPDTVMIWTYGYALTWIVGLASWLRPGGEFRPAANGDSQGQVFHRVVAVRRVDPGYRRLDGPLPWRHRLSVDVDPLCLLRLLLASERDRPLPGASAEPWFRVAWRRQLLPLSHAPAVPHRSEGSGPGPQRPSLGSLDHRGRSCAVHSVRRPGRAPVAPRGAVARGEDRRKGEASQVKHSPNLTGEGRPRPNLPGPNPGLTVELIALL